MLLLLLRSQLLHVLAVVYVKIKPDGCNCMADSLIVAVQTTCKPRPTPRTTLRSGHDPTPANASVQALNAEVVVAVEGTNEFGDTFAARQSYLPSEVNWGHVFKQILFKAPPGSTRHYVNVSGFHGV